MLRTVSELAAAYENQAVRIETGVPPEQSSKDSEEGRGVSCQAACPQITNSRWSNNPLNELPVRHTVARPQRNKA
jgi:hypothetical protein